MDNPTDSWKGGKGYISKEMAVKGLPHPGDDTLILVSNYHPIKSVISISSFHVVKVLKS